ncbi:sensor domain-containing diguanylate cyclase [Alteromonas gilva]|uniref:diguanylate cyclase n=1 Tax=Alteromonas gilva TaxID=2987522 RepID=A0ABT5L4P5_9ALTE|nr:diguanylate cyclase [Alteromonas gilva]MDC8832024.1 diguanylate cyclase [Alteromonas gilva]
MGNTTISALIRHILLVVIWLALWRLSVFNEYAPHASIWFPPAGFTFACFLLLRWYAAPAMLLSCLLSTVWESFLFNDGRSTQELIQAGTLFAIMHCGVYGVSANYLRSFIDRISHQNLYQPVMRFLLVAASSSLVMSSVGIMVLYDGVHLPTLVQSWLAWWIGDMSGLLVLVPVFIGLVNRIYPRQGLLFALRYEPSGRSDYLLFAAKLAITSTLLIAVALATNYSGSAEVASLVFFIALPQMWIVHTESPMRVAVSVALFSFLAALLVSLLQMGEQAYIFQVAISVVASAAYFTMAVPALVSHNQALYKEVRTDYLSQTVMRQHFIKLAEQNLKHASRYNFETALLLFDIDNFKQINDQYGHLIGDEVLQKFARMVKSKIRESDIIGRFGGDEFMLLLPQTSLQSAYKVAESIRCGMLELKISNPDVKPSCSVGAAAMTRESGFKGAFEEADQALLQAKRGGRNRTTLNSTG